MALFGNNNQRRFDQLADELVSHINRLAQGDYQARIDLTGEDATDRIVRALQKLQRSLQDQDIDRERALEQMAQRAQAIADQQETTTLQEKMEGGTEKLRLALNAVLTNQQQQQQGGLGGLLGSGRTETGAARRAPAARSGECAGGAAAFSGRWAFVLKA